LWYGFGEMLQDPTEIREMAAAMRRHEGESGGAGR